MRKSHKTCTQAKVIDMGSDKSIENCLKLVKADAACGYGKFTDSLRIQDKSKWACHCCEKGMKDDAATADNDWDLYQPVHQCRAGREAIDGSEVRRCYESSLVKLWKESGSGYSKSDYSDEMKKQLDDGHAFAAGKSDGEAGGGKKMSVGAGIGLAAGIAAAVGLCAGVGMFIAGKQAGERRKQAEQSATEEEGRQTMSREDEQSASPKGSQDATYKSASAVQI